MRARAEQAQKAAKMGVDAVSTTLAGYVPGALHTEDELYTPNLELVKEIAAMHLPCSLVVEGRIWDKEDLAKAMLVLKKALEVYNLEK